MSRREQTGLEDELGPILPGPGASDYERYLRTDELLALQKTEAERAHHDELLFQVTHQSSELWLKLGAAEVETATAEMRARRPARGDPVAAQGDPGAEARSPSSSTCSS